MRLVSAILVCLFVTMLIGVTAAAPPSGPNSIGAAKSEPPQGAAASRSDSGTAQHHQRAGAHRLRQSN
uniref:Secreted protein n=1 Tax=Macrostomum lignano TaxID=282301 RepID=A0A1I8I0T9_9PLAT